MKKIILVITVLFLLTSCNNKSDYNATNTHEFIVFSAKGGFFESDVTGNIEKLNIPDEGSYNNGKRYAYFVGTGQGIVHFKANNAYLNIDGDKYKLEYKCFDGVLSKDKNKFIYTSEYIQESKTNIYDVNNNTTSFIEQDNSNLFPYALNDDASVILLIDTYEDNNVKYDDIGYFGSLYEYTENELVLKDENASISGYGRNTISETGEKYIYAKDFDLETKTCKLIYCVEGKEDVVISNKLDVINANLGGQGFKISKDGNLVGALEMEGLSRSLLLYYYNDEAVRLPDVYSFYISDNNTVHYLKETGVENSYELYKIDKNKGNIKLADDVGRVAAVSPNGEIVVVYKDLKEIEGLKEKPANSEYEGLYIADESMYYGDMYWISEVGKLNSIDNEVFVSTGEDEDSESIWIATSNNTVVYSKGVLLYAMEYGKEKIVIYEGELSSDIGGFRIIVD